MLTPSLWECTTAPCKSTRLHHVKVHSAQFYSINILLFYLLIYLFVYLFICLFISMVLQTVSSYLFLKNFSPFFYSPFLRASIGDARSSPSASSRVVFRRALITAFASRFPNNKLWRRERRHRSRQMPSSSDWLWKAGGRGLAH